MVAQLNVEYMRLCAVNSVYLFVSLCGMGFFEMTKERTRHGQPRLIYLAWALQLGKRFQDCCYFGKRKVGPNWAALHRRPVIRRIRMPF